MDNTKTLYVITALTGSGRAYITDEHGACPRFEEAKLFTRFIDAWDYRKKYWNDPELGSQIYEVSVTVKQEPM